MLILCYLICQTTIHYTLRYVDIVIRFLNFETEHMNDTVRVPVQILTITFQVTVPPGFKNLAYFKRYCGCVSLCLARLCLI